LALLQLGFTVPLTLPRARWALTRPQPFGRHRFTLAWSSDRSEAIGGLFSVALSVAHRCAPRHYLAACPAEPGLSSIRHREPCGAGAVSRPSDRRYRAGWRRRKSNTACVGPAMTSGWLWRAIRGPPCNVTR